MPRLTPLAKNVLISALALGALWVGYTLSQNARVPGPDSPRTAAGTRWLAAAGAQPQTDANSIRPAAEEATDGDDPNEPNGAGDPTDANGPSGTMTDNDANEAPGLGALALLINPHAAKPARPSRRDPLAGEALNLKNVEARFVIEAIARWTGKTVIPTDKVLGERLTIVSPRRLSQAEALQQIYGALRVRGYVAEETDTSVFIRPLSDSRLSVVPTLSATQPLAAVENREQVVQKFFRLRYYDPARMLQILQPLVGSYGHISAEASSGQLLVIDTVANLLRIENVIAQFDLPESESLETRIFELRHRPPGEIVTLLQTLLADEQGPAATPVGSASRVAAFQALRKTAKRSPRVAGSSAPPPGAAVTVGDARQRMVLIAEPRFNWIIAKATADRMGQIEQWIERLDKALPTITTEQSLEEVDNKNQVVQRFLHLDHYPPSRMVAILQPLLNDSGFVSADESTGNLLLIDTVENLLRLERIVAQFDQPQTQGQVTEIFTLRHRDPEETVAVLESLLGQEPTRRSGMGRTPRSAGLSPRLRSGRGPAAVAVGQTGRTVTLIPEPTQNWVIAKAAPEDINDIATWIERLDTPVPLLSADARLEDLENRNQVVQKFVTLQHYPPSRMAELLRPLVGDRGYIGADDTIGSLLLVDTVENLLRLERIIAQFDRTDSLSGETRVFELRHRKPDEIVGMLQSLLGQESDPRANRSLRPDRSAAAGRSRPGRSGGAVVVGVSGRPVQLIPDETQQWIIAKAAPADLDQIAQWIERLDCSTPTILAVDSLAELSDPGQRVQWCVRLQSYTPTQMAEIVLPLMDADGYVSADDNTGHLLLIDTVETLRRVEALIAEFDVPEAQDSTTQVFVLLHSDPAEATQILRMLLGDIYGGRPGRGAARPLRTPAPVQATAYSSRLTRGGLRVSAATNVLIGAKQMPIVLIPEPQQGWIIARASQEDLDRIAEWITKIDVPQQNEREYETVPITYADVREVGTQLSQALSQMPGTELQASVLVQPLERARQIVLFGRADLREMLKKLIEEIDVPPGQFETRHFVLQYADPDQVKQNLDALFGPALGGRTRGGFGARGGGTTDAVKVVAHAALKQVTVVATPEDMLKIAEQIPEWDVPLDVNAVQPRIIELFNSDPVQMSNLLNGLFSEETRGNNAWVESLLGLGGAADRKRIIGPLYGQVTIEEVPGTKKIVVISNIPEAYAVVEKLVQELDKREAAEVPQVISLKYADPEALAERLNAMFNEAGTTATIQRSQHGLAPVQPDPSSDEPAGRSAANARSGNETVPDYRPWWTTGRRDPESMPISNIIGRVRFIPDPRSKALLVLAPPEFLADIVELVQALDIPGKQVMVKAVVVQVDHRDMSSLGLQLSSDPAQFAASEENSLIVRNALSQLERHGSLVFGAGGDSGSRFEGGVNLDLNVMLDFLVKNLHAKILNQQTLWTKDNEEAQFFKGQRVPFQTRVSISDTGGRATSSYDYEKVGMTLRTRPSITPEKQVDMIVNITLSHLTADEINNQPIRDEMETTTNMIVDNSQTLMLGGMLFQEDTQVVRRIPLLGDLPLLGRLFRHRHTVLANSELLVFITPYVMEEGDVTGEAIDTVVEAQQTLESVRQSLSVSRSPAEDPNERR